MHARREIDHILDQISEIIAKNKTSNKENKDDKAMIEHLKQTINLKTDDGKRAKGMWTDSPEFNCTNIYGK
jgi:peptidoglycan hydrolase CwlO-like protein